MSVSEEKRKLNKKNVFTKFGLPEDEVWHTLLFRVHHGGENASNLYAASSTLIRQPYKVVVHHFRYSLCTGTGHGCEVQTKPYASKWHLQCTALQLSWWNGWFKLHDLFVGRRFGGAQICSVTNHESVFKMHQARQK